MIDAYKFIYCVFYILYKIMQFRKKEVIVMDDNHEKADMQQIQDSLNELRQQYAGIEQRIQNVEQSRMDVAQMNQNIQQIMNKLNMIDERRAKTVKDAAMKKDAKKMICNPLRKLTIATIRAVLTVADKSLESAEHFREGLEDIIAEAHYENKKSKMKTVEQH